MKSNIVLLLFYFLTIDINAQSSDYAKVEKTITDYLNSYTYNGFDIINEALYHQGIMQSVFPKSADQHLNTFEVYGVKKSNTPETHRSNQITCISITGKEAHAKLEISYPEYTVVDDVHLLKTNAKWKIVDKKFSP